MINFELPQMKYPEQKGLVSIIIPIYNSRGEFIANLDSDDAYRPQYLEKMFVKIKNGFMFCCGERL
jgi:cellulose synthase/poly-beta-1,6-N-acetylglucosamine synthase-like glycosyltransferase